jgi:hypothetical protein
VGRELASVQACPGGHFRSMKSRVTEPPDLRYVEQVESADVHEGAIRNERELARHAGSALTQKGTNMNSATGREERVASHWPKLSTRSLLIAVCVIHWITLGPAFARGTFGDFNGDGHDDFAVGLPKGDLPFREDVGLVHVIYGSASGLEEGTQTWHADLLTGAQEGAHFGKAVKAGDFNGDGYEDLAVSSPEAADVVLPPPPSPPQAVSAQQPAPVGRRSPIGAVGPLGVGSPAAR